MQTKKPRDFDNVELVVIGLLFVAVGSLLCRAGVMSMLAIEKAAESILPEE